MTDEIEDVPHLTRDLIPWLLRKVPERCIQANETEVQARCYSAIREFVTELAAVWEEQEHREDETPPAQESELLPGTEVQYAFAFKCDDEL